MEHSKSNIFWNKMYNELKLFIEYVSNGIVGLKYLIELAKKTDSPDV